MKYSNNGQNPSNPKSMNPLRDTTTAAVYPCCKATQHYYNN